MLGEILVWRITVRLPTLLSISLTLNQELAIPVLFVWRQGEVLWVALACPDL
jgi:hypothetical protein